ncbi:MAG TPA: hypothetical protein VHP54_04165, partial [Caproiciproducens sp.]|nr:hypothetical protein [Caproiciproducens sp.]
MIPKKVTGFKAIDGKYRMPVSPAAQPPKTVEINTISNIKATFRKPCLLRGAESPETAAISVEIRPADAPSY